jgi:hypothetical protein
VKYTVTQKASIYYREEWTKYGTTIFHRECGPAVIWEDGHSQKFIDGKEIKENNLIKFLRRLKSIKITKKSS